MTNTDILIKLRDLHEELSNINDDLKVAEQVDEQTIDALGQLVTDVGSLMDRTSEINESAEAGDAEHPDQLMARVRQFESDHPSVTRFLSQVTDVLGMFGI